MKRRDFIGTGAALSLPLMLNGFGMGVLSSKRMQSMIDEDNDRILVLIQLNGGNDGLNTIFSYDQFANLQNVRSNIIVPENSLIDLDGNRGLHPAMTGMKEVWENGYLGIVQGVAYPNQNRSHFRSTDIWHTASAADEYRQTGWLGRYFDLEHQGYPEGYPNAQYPDPFAITVGGGISETCQGTGGSYCLSIVDPLNPGRINIGQESAAPDNCYGHELEYVRSVALQANSYADILQDSAEGGSNVSDKYNDNSLLSQKLKTVAKLISGGLKTKVYVVSISGFDLHSAQVDPTNTQVGRHAELLTELSDAICAFQDDLVKQGLDKRVLGMTYSEFGRRIRSNGSDGTDHGTAAPMFLFGTCVKGGVLGEDPEIDTQVDIQEGVAMQYDFRSVYGTIFMDWFKVEEETVKDILFDDFQYLPLLEDCELVSNEESPELVMDVKSFPNPFSNYLQVQFSLPESDEMYLSLFNALGAVVKSQSRRTLAAGNHQLQIETRDLPTGNYFLRLSGKTRQKTVKLVKTQ